jgi:hypothetical protein
VSRNQKEGFDKEDKKDNNPPPMTKTPREWIEDASKRKEEIRSGICDSWVSQSQEEVPLEKLKKRAERTFNQRREILETALSALGIELPDAEVTLPDPSSTPHGDDMDIYENIIRPSTEINAQIETAVNILKARDQKAAEAELSKPVEDDEFELVVDEADLVDDEPKAPHATPPPALPKEIEVDDSPKLVEKPKPSIKPPKRMVLPGQEPDAKPPEPKKQSLWQKALGRKPPKEKPSK